MRIGALRWCVTILERRQEPSGDHAGIDEIYARRQSVRADVQPIGALTFWGAQQTETPVTHRITIRWLDGLDNRQAILRETSRLDGTVRTELFRVRRVAEVGGRKRFLSLECELERIVDVQPED